MIAQLKYGSGTPFYRMEQLESQLGISCGVTAVRMLWQRTLGEVGFLLDCDMAAFRRHVEVP
jgi:hypothetical protein